MTCQDGAGVLDRDFTDYSHGRLPAGASDHVRRVHVWSRNVCRVEEGAVVCVVLIQRPLGGVLYHLLTFQLENVKHIKPG